MTAQLLYLMPDPHAKNWVKAGKSKLPTFQMRIGNYQQGNGPNYKVTWPHCWIGEKTAVDNLERTIMTLFKEQRPLQGRGYTEWIENETVESMISKIDEIVRGYGFKVEPVEQDLLPITVDNVKQVQDRYMSEKI